MKILYSIQATGNGHISRAMELLPYLQQYGHVDVFLSGANSTLQLDAPVKFRNAGISLFYNCNGSLNYTKTLAQLSLARIRKAIRELPVEQYDFILNDFDCITSMACAKKKIPSLNFGHQASFMSMKTPRPARISKTGEWILRNYARATNYVGLHFDNYDEFILTPVIKKEIFYAGPQDGGFITVYLPSYCEPELLQHFSTLKDHRFEIFSWQADKPKIHGNITFLPVSKSRFNTSLVRCHAIICGAGFETPAEALHLDKKMMVMPIKGQYEQCCNAAALEKLGVKTFTSLDPDFSKTFNDWMASPKHQTVTYTLTTAAIVERAMQKCRELRPVTDETQPLCIDDLVNMGQ